MDRYEHLVLIMLDDGRFWIENSLPGMGSEFSSFGAALRELEKNGFQAVGVFPHNFLAISRNAFGSYMFKRKAPGE